MPQIALRGFQKVHLEPGASQKVHFDLKDRDLVMVTENSDPIIAAGNYTISIGGGQPDTGAPTVAGALPDRWPAGAARIGIPCFGSERCLNQNTTANE